MIAMANNIPASLACDCTVCRAHEESIFSELGSYDLDILASARSTRSYSHGETIFSPHNGTAGLYCILEGKVEICRTGRNGKEQVIRLVGEGDIMGYRSLLSGEQEGSYARAMEYSRVCHIPKDAFLGLMMSNPGVAARLMTLLSTDLRIAEEKIVELAHRPVRERVAEVLLMLRETYGLEEDQATINVSMTRNQLASIIGTAMESVSRQLSRFKQEGMIDLVGRKIKILDDHALKTAANLDQ
jgi:CRP/FNR family transcriptional regulator, polysaccharide utilization system transcription regulator